MSVELHNVTKRLGGGQRTLFENVNLRVDIGERLGILGQPKSGKSTLLRLICGTEFNAEGIILRNSTVSWPIPFGDFLVASSTVATNIRFIGRLYGVGEGDFAQKIGELAGVTEFLNEELAACPPHVRVQLTFALGVGTDFDIYLFDENIAPGKKEFKEKALGIVQALTPRHGIVLATTVPKDITTYCDTVFVLDDGHAIHYENVDEGIKHYKSLSQDAASERVERPARVEQLPEEIDGVLGI